MFFGFEADSKEAVKKLVYKMEAYSKEHFLRFEAVLKDHSEKIETFSLTFVENFIATQILFTEMNK